uniref:Uncharacterized protein n=1 Tax=Acrobeloides nanus TaxID=290746 RepID=A0A914CQF3_9BILA
MNDRIVDDMGDRKRNKPGSSGVQEEKNVDWVKKYLRKDSDLCQALRDNTDLAVKNKGLEKDLKYANDEILRLHSMLSARGVVEYYDRKHQMLKKVRNDTRFNRWLWIFKNDRTFRDNVDNSFGYRPHGYEVASIVGKIFSNTSADINSFDKSKGLQISTTDYTSDEQKILQSICASIPCNITIE